MAENNYLKIIHYTLKDFTRIAHIITHSGMNCGEVLYKNFPELELSLCQVWVT